RTSKGRARLEHDDVPWCCRVDRVLEIATSIHRTNSSSGLRVGRIKEALRQLGQDFGLEDARSAKEEKGCGFQDQSSHVKTSPFDSSNPLRPSHSTVRLSSRPDSRGYG